MSEQSHVQGASNEWKLATDLITILEAKVVVLDVELKVGEDQLGESVNMLLSKAGTTTDLFPDLLPDDTSHLIAVELDNGVLDSNLLEWGGHGDWVKKMSYACGNLKRR